MKTTSAFPEPSHTQTPNNFFEMIPGMSDAELRVTLVMIRNTFGWHKDSFKMGINKLADAAGLSRNGAKDGAEAAEKRGTFRRTNPDQQTEAEWELVVGQPVTTLTDRPGGGQPVTINRSASDQQVGVKERKEIEKKGDAVDLLLSTMTDKELSEQEACHKFEQAFQFGKLPWHSTRVWSSMAKFVTEIHQRDPLVFGKYIIWRSNGGKYQAMSNKQIRLNPQVFMDTGWMEFEIFHKAEQKADEPTHHDPIHERIRTPRPAHIPPPRIGGNHD